MTIDENVKKIHPSPIDSRKRNLVVTPSVSSMTTTSPKSLAMPSSLYPNPVMAAADPLLRQIASCTKETFSAQTAVDWNKGIKAFEDTLRRWRYPNDKIVLGRQVLQAYVQLSLHKLSSDHEEPRTIQSHPLLAHLEKLAKKAQQYIDILELLYLCLNLDLTVQEKEDKAWQMILKRIYQFIYIERGEMERKLIVDIVPFHSIHTMRSLAIAFLKMLGISVVVLLGMYGASFYLLNAYSDHFSHDLEVINQNLETMK